MLNELDDLDETDTNLSDWRRFACARRWANQLPADGRFGKPPIV